MHSMNAVVSLEVEFMLAVERKTVTVIYKLAVELQDYGMNNPILN
jgi:hypothetical protein